MATSSNRRQAKQVVLPSRLYGASFRGGGGGRGRGDGGRDRGKLVITDGERVRGGGERVIGGGKRGRGDAGRDKGKGKAIEGKGKGYGGRGRIYVDESDSDCDSDSNYECEDARLEDSGDEIDGGEEAEGYDDMEGDEMESDDISFERGARSVCYGDYKTPPKKGDPKLGVVEFIDDKTFRDRQGQEKDFNFRVLTDSILKFFEKGRQREAFLNRCVKKFRRYYYYPKGFTKGEAKSVVREHLRRNMKHTMFIMKKNASKEANVEETGEILSELELFDIVYTKKHVELMKIKEAMEHAEKELPSQHGPDEPPLSPASRRKRNVLVVLHAQLRKLDDGAYPSKDDPTQLVFWDQYMKISTNLTASLFERYKKVVIKVDDHANDQVDDQANDGNANRRNNDEEGSFNNVPLSP
ncbi:hypothetical protein POM88_027710 [Heracleum sosnowskyi]|uniref:Uncharacterized protein n=1 Tax=Heracleum sosnowskyi TaxID=360622 RepID=A0AAD8I9I2_9APIA|nr:hypothetical protein POM88_027710 [Heracleum sosnowskyi]